MNNKTALSTALFLAFGLSACSVDAPTTEDFDYSFLEATPQDDFSDELGFAGTQQPSDASLNIRFRDSDHGVDAEFEKVASVPLVIEAVAVETTDSHGNTAWQSVRKKPIEVDLFSLADGDVERLGAGPVPSGEYTGIRVVLGESSLETTDGAVHDLSLPGEVLELTGHFDLDENESLTLLIDFAGLRSLENDGEGWVMDPVPSVHVVHSSHGSHG